MTWRVRWRELRAGLIAFAIFLALVEGCPIPPPHEVEDWQRGYVSLVRPVQRTIMTPFAWLPRELQITQRFALFQAAEADRYRFVIAGRTRDGVERTLFRAGDDGPYAALLTQRRLRGVWNPTRHTMRQYPAFTRWFARRAFAEHADLVAITFRFERLHISDGIPTPTGKTAFISTIGRGAP